MANKVIFLTTGTTFSAPVDWPPNNIALKVETIAGGGAGAAGSPSVKAGAGGGGGAYAIANNVTIANGASYQIGQGGATVNASGTDSWMVSTGTLLAKAGIGASTSSVGGLGGAAASCFPTLGAFSGGQGGGGAALGAGDGGGGGGGAGGPHGAGGNGSADGPTLASGGGGGGGGGGANGGAGNGTTTSGAGGNNYLGAGGGAGGTASVAGATGTAGGGGGGGWTAAFLPGDGGFGTDWDSTHGSGGGGGGAGRAVAGNAAHAGAGGLYGGGGGGTDSSSANFSPGANGIIVITYTPTPYVIQKLIKPSGGSGTSDFLAYASNITVGSSGHCVVKCITGSTITVADNLNGAWTSRGAAINDGSHFSRQFTIDNMLAGATTVTATFSPSATSTFLVIVEIGGTSGFDTSVQQLQATLSNSTTTDSITSGTTAPSTQPGLLSGIVYSGGTSVASAAGTGFTLGVGPTNNITTESLVYSALTAIAVTFTGNSNTSTPFSTYGAFFKPLAGGSTNYTLSCAMGPYAYTGQAANFNLGPTAYTLLAAPGVYNYEGGQTNTGWGDNMAVGIYGYVGRAASLVWSGAPVQTGPSPSSLKQWIPFDFACRLNCLQRGTLNVGNTQQNRLNLLALSIAQANSPSNPQWAKYSTAANMPKKLLLRPYYVPGFIAPTVGGP